ncbi:MAG: lysine-2,3-aminomutase-like protein [Rhodospirillales bacterium]|nr:lysine-2,3-aminomutase-like protein [Rhodospirillales bacterium]
MTLRRIQDLVAAGLVEPERAAALERVASRYAVAVTPAMAALVESPGDPIGRQFVPSEGELAITPEERLDPIGDAAHEAVPGLVHRYPDRVLLKPHHACAVYCRFCFRREQVGPGGAALDARSLERALDYIRARPAIWEVILSGGDPLLLSPRRLKALIGKLDEIPHLGSIRIHTRVPVVAPERVSAAALAAEKAVWVVLHVNHARELSEEARRAIGKLVRAGIPLLAQTVLLKGVNDDPDTLEALFRALVALRVKPYYLHHPDLAPGTASFRGTIEAGQAAMRALRGRLSGIAQPTYVLDIPGGYGKVPVGPVYLADGIVEDPWGGKHSLNPEGASSSGCGTSSARASTGTKDAATGATRSRRSR